MSSQEDPLREALDICEKLIADGREGDALKLLRERILPVLEERAEQARRERS